jgi:hypothetical protein
MLMKRILIVLAILIGLGVVVAAVVGLGCNKTWKVETGKLSDSFASAPLEVKADIQKALGAINSRDFATALGSLKKVVDTGNLTDTQKAALNDAVTDITTIISGDPPPNADQLYDLIAEITEALGY